MQDATVSRVALIVHTVVGAARLCAERWSGSSAVWHNRRDGMEGSCVFLSWYTRLPVLLVCAPNAGLARLQAGATGDNWHAGNDPSGDWCQNLTGI